MRMLQQHKVSGVEEVNSELLIFFNVWPDKASGDKVYQIVQ